MLDSHKFTSIFCLQTRAIPALLPYMIALGDSLVDKSSNDFHALQHVSAALTQVSSVCVRVCICLTSVCVRVWRSSLMSKYVCVYMPLCMW
jgi:hypothetical protein